MALVLKGLTEVTIVSAIRDIVEQIVKIFAIPVCFGHVFMEDAVSQKERNVDVYAYLHMSSQTATLLWLIYVNRTLVKMAGNARFFLRRMTTFVTALENLLGKTAQYVVALKPNKCKMMHAKS